MTTPVDSYVSNIVNNIFDYMTDLVGTPFLLNNIDTMKIHNDANDLITKTSQDKTESWTSGDASGEFAEDWAKEPDSAQKLQDLLDGKGGNFRHKITDYDIGNFSSKVLTNLLNLFSTHYNDAPIKDNQSGDSTTLNAMNSLVSSSGNSDQQSGQNLIKIMQSVISNDANAQQPVVSILDKIQQYAATCNSIGQQRFS